MKAKATKRVIAMVTRVARDNKGIGNGNKGGGRATAMRAMVEMTIVVGKNEGGGNGNEGGGQQRR